ncbi:MAG TPA: cytochrome d ubiquinol oxidase subunit II [Burkholderiales bacterium]|nr:cytochrome d ubiquinol oxidase subunit II [Burkholderiales bacterium]
MIFDYVTLKFIWWLFVGVLLIGFAVMDGFDMGIGTLLPFLGKTDEERRVIINSVGATWEGNQVWFVTAGGAFFAAWPLVYAAAFSGFYIALMLTLFALFFRPVGFDYRSKVHDPRWRNAWDWGLFAGGSIPALIFGVAFGNLLLGVPFHYDADLRVTYSGSFWALLNPFALLSGVVSLSMLTLHGAVYLQNRTEGDICGRAKAAAKVSAIVMIITFVLAGIWIATGIEGYKIISMPSPNSVMTPLAKVVEKSSGAWLNNYSLYPWTIVVPILAIGGAVIALLLSAANRPATAFIFSAMSVSGVILTAGLAMFPFIMPSSTFPNSSLTAWDAVSSHRTLQIMFWAAVVFLPLIAAYTSWVYRVLRGKITVQSIREDEHTAY